MPDNSSQAPNSGKKARLGRGLGSLLGGGGLDITSDSAPAVEQQSAASPTRTTPPPATAPTSPKTAASPAAPAGASVSPSPKAQNVATSSPTTTQKPAEAVPSAIKAEKAAPTQPTASQLTSQSSAAAPAAKVVPSQPQAAQPAPVQNHQSQTTTARTAEQPRAINEESQIWMIAVDKLKPNTQQPRQIFTPEALKDLSASIKEKGILQPITARRLNEREFEIIAGERRWRAAQAAGLHQVPVILKKVSEQDSLELAIIENIQRENLNPLEEAEAYDRLMIDYSLTQQLVADKMGKDRSTVANSLRLLALPGEIKEFLRKNEISAGHAKVLLGLDDPKVQVKIAKQIVSEKLSVRATEKMVARAKIEARGETHSNSHKENVSKRAIEGLSAELQKLIGTKVVIDYADSKGKLSIHFYTDDQFNHVVEKLRKAWEKR